MDPDHEQVARIGLTAVRDQGYALAGGHALAMHGIGSRPSKDVDLFTDQQQTDFGQTVARLQTAYGEQGYSVNVTRQADEYAQLQLTKDGRTTQLELGRDYRSRPAVESSIGPVISVQDAVGSKVGTVYQRGEAKDYVDLQAAAQSGRYTHDELLALADEREASPMDRGMFAEQLDFAARIPDRDYAQQGLSPEQIATLKQDMSGWARELRTRAESPDLDNALRLMQTGSARQAPGRSGQTGEAARRSPSYEQDRGRDDRDR
ncbi:nucleotidyl transferase AbiEii/AbiGii toxin family protein [Kribbella sp. CA-253562]|uniref:nucleotidyl transferase AbiEii/AbiGii toxin family protein n=1 Tax=Kribbella sp. CA-253562 TaxID=3239942 RepID=UPI003D930DC6